MPKPSTTGERCNRRMRWPRGNERSSSSALQATERTPSSTLESKPAELPRLGQDSSMGAWTMLLGLVEALAVLGKREEAANLYPLVIELIKTGNERRVMDSRSTQSLAGIAAAAGERWEQAEQHHQAALYQADGMSIVIEQPEARRWYARMLIDRDGPGDREKARQLLNEANRHVPAHRHAEARRDGSLDAG